MRAFIAWLSHFLRFQRASNNFEDTSAYKAGYRSAEQMDFINPYRPGTISHRQWAAGSLRQQRDAMTYW